MPPVLSVGQLQRKQEDVHRSSSLLLGGSVSLWAVRGPAYVKQLSLWINWISLFLSDNCHWKGKSKTDIREFLAGWQQGSEQDFAGREHSICALRFLNARFPIRFTSLHSPSGSWAVFPKATKKKRSFQTRLSSKLSTGHDKHLGVTPVPLAARKFLSVDYNDIGWLSWVKLVRLENDIDATTLGFPWLSKVLCISEQSKHYRHTPSIK